MELENLDGFQFYAALQITNYQESNDYAKTAFIDVVRVGGDPFDIITLNAS
jgi:hypothetical protein